ncbi:MAG: hypothetical protein K8L91_12520 [Anaerolineae bacterium]|nr:hypothetical protein [Anaerolineae bacterium]
MTLYIPALQLVGISSETAAKVEVIALPVGRHLSLKAHGQTLVVLNGSAWVSFDGADFILRRGESVTLNTSPLSACVSAVGDKPVMLEVR